MLSGIIEGAHFPLVRRPHHKTGAVAHIEPFLGAVVVAVSVEWLFATWQWHSAVQSWVIIPFREAAVCLFDANATAELANMCQRLEPQVAMGMPLTTFILMVIRFCTIHIVHCKAPASLRQVITKCFMVMEAFYLRGDRGGPVGLVAELPDHGMAQYCYNKVMWGNACPKIRQRFQVSVDISRR